MKKLLLIIDPQVDFVSPRVDAYGGLPGRLYILGAENNIEKLADWIKIHTGEIDSILCTQDTHFTTHIGHPKAWKDERGHIVDPFKNITAEQVELGKYTPTQISKDRAVSYLKSLEEKGAQHTIWPVHCLAGSVGQGFDQKIIDALEIWTEKKNKHYGIIQKGARDDAEMYSAFSYADGSNPGEFKGWLDRIDSENFDEIIIAGFAKDYCVAETVKDLVMDGRFKDKLRFLESGMACINSKNPSLSIYEEAIKNYGAKSI
jgi:putative nicotinamidase